MARSSGVGTHACTTRTSSALRIAAGSSAAHCRRHVAPWHAVVHAAQRNTVSEVSPKTLAPVVSFSNSSQKLVTTVHPQAKCLQVAGVFC